MGAFSPAFLLNFVCVQTLTVSCADAWRRSEPGGRSGTRGLDGERNMTRGKTYCRYRRGGRFFGRRVDCEYVPLLPARAVRRVLEDPRKIPYLLIWKSYRDGEVKEAVCIAPYSEPPDSFPFDWNGWVQIKRPGGERTLVSTVLHALPRNGGKVRLLVCPFCQLLRKALYGWEAGGQFTTSARRLDWTCRSCSGLRYSSEGGGLVFRGRGAFFRALEMQFGSSRADRPVPWYPYVFSSPADAVAAGLCNA